MRTVFYALCAAMMLTAPPAWAQPAISWEPYTVKASSGAAVASEMGWLEVPERHGRPAAQKIRLPVIRLRATGPNPGPPMLWLAGGPGEPGTRRVAASYPLFEALRAYGDVIVFDQRGTGMAEPNLAVPGQFDLPASHGIDSPQAQARLVEIAGKIRDTIRDRGVDLGAYNTRESADDVELLRQALGAEKIVLVAHSYGTHLALATIKRHGRHVSRAILAGVNGLEDRWREPVSSDQWLDRVAQTLRNDPSAPNMDFTAQVKRVFDQLEREPILVRDPGGDILVGKSEVQELVILRSGDLPFIRNLPVLFANLEKREKTEEVAKLVQQTIRQRPIGTAMTYAMHVASGASRERLRTVTAQKNTAIFGNAINWGIGDAAFVDALDVPDLGPSFRSPFRSNVPVLFVSANLDGRSSESDARKVGRQFSRATYLTVNGASHDLIFRTLPPGVAEAMGAFLKQEVLSDAQIEVPLRF
jgi:pimeloyl-ACP methyl ester carboxylesterase